MAWRPNEQIIDGWLDNTIHGKITGQLRFAGLNKTVKILLEGNFQINGRRIVINNPNPIADPDYMESFDPLQDGKVGSMCFKGYWYLEWYSNNNGRVCLELDKELCRAVPPHVLFMEKMTEIVW